MSSTSRASSSMLFPASLAIAVAAFVFLAASAPARACVVCDEVVVVNDALAGCFLGRYDSLAAELTASGKRFLKADFSSCTGATGGERAVSTVPGAAQRKLKSAYVFDKAGLTCLHGLITNHTGRFDPNVRFDLAQQCRE